ncbi:hypothetical protein BY996DRAFT_4584652 [Phakopsora pachyrhizi]|uniref:Steroid 5-alpha reductase C-terminal domain-containing protein n=2 Tax=Phakopsora pachyrhizi TaxID=170000 RepID=A0AAV0B5V4_PHAPC|nr:hypothetical protein BY996DRAFT_4584652 [Phakopsora pachyrhizi]CAH7677581.1 hypothetical protein PPACK8108_LOCUS12751 [Phakopsora pachyrhizi]
MASSTAGSILATVATAFAIQSICATFAIPSESERYYDLSGSATFISSTMMSLYYPSLRKRFLLGQASVRFPSITQFHPRQIIMTTTTCLWASRLGIFLYKRIQKSGSDSRFDEIKKDPIKFFGAWMAQATWVSLTAFPVYAVNSIPVGQQTGLGLSGKIGTGLWISSFLFEVIADRQKTVWREEKSKKLHDQKFISSGLWSLTRHPNYLGEVMIWTSQLIISWSTLTPLLRAISCLSPIFEYLLITKVSGVPLLEAQADKRFKDDKEYQEYKERTPVFWPKFW